MSVVFGQSPLPTSGKHPVNGIFDRCIPDLCMHPCEVAIRLWRPCAQKEGLHVRSFGWWGISFSGAQCVTALGRCIAFWWNLIKVDDIRLIAYLIVCV